MARVDDGQNRLKLLLNPEEAPLPSDDEIADLMEKAAIRLEGTVTRARQMDRTIKRLELTNKALDAEKEKRDQVPDKAKKVHDLKTSIAEKLDDDDSVTTPSASPAGTP